MSKYKIVVSGRGFDCKVFPLTDDQLEALSEISEELEDALTEETMEVIVDVTGKNFLENDIDYFEAEKSLFGPNDSEGDYSLSVFDEKETLVYKTPENWLKEQFQSDDEAEDFQDEYWENGKLVMAQYCKADFYEYELSLDGAFDPAKLRGFVTLVAETFSLLTDIYYDGQKLEYSELFQDVTYSSYYGQLMNGG